MHITAELFARPYDTWTHDELQEGLQYAEQVGNWPVTATEIRDELGRRQAEQPPHGHFSARR